MNTNTQTTAYKIKYYSRSDGKKVNRPYNPERQYEFVAKNGNLIKCYWDEKKRLLEKIYYGKHRLH